MDQSKNETNSNSISQVRPPEPFGPQEPFGLSQMVMDPYLNSHTIPLNQNFSKPQDFSQSNNQLEQFSNIQQGDLNNSFKIQQNKSNKIESLAVSDDVPITESNFVINIDEENKKENQKTQLVLEEEKRVIMPQDIQISLAMESNQPQPESQLSPTSNMLPNAKEDIAQDQEPKYNVEYIKKEDQLPESTNLNAVEEYGLQKENADDDDQGCLNSEDINQLAEEYEQKELNEKKKLYTNENSNITGMNININQHEEQMNKVYTNKPPEDDNEFTLLSPQSQTQSGSNPLNANENQFDINANSNYQQQLTFGQQQHGLNPEMQSNAIKDQKDQQTLDNSNQQQDQYQTPCKQFSEQSSLNKLSQEQLDQHTQVNVVKDQPYGQQQSQSLPLNQIPSIEPQQQQPKPLFYGQEFKNPNQQQEQLQPVNNNVSPSLSSPLPLVDKTRIDQPPFNQQPFTLQQQYSLGTNIQQQQQQPPYNQQPSQSPLGIQQVQSPYGQNQAPQLNSNNQQTQPPYEQHQSSYLQQNKGMGQDYISSPEVSKSIQNNYQQQLPQNFNPNQQTFNTIQNTAYNQCGDNAMNNYSNSESEGYGQHANLFQQYNINNPQSNYNVNTFTHQNSQGNNNMQMGYTQQMAYGQPQAGYSQQMSYGQQQMGYSQQMAYGQPQTGYNQQMAYGQPQIGYNQQIPYGNNPQMRFNQPQYFNQQPNQQQAYMNKFYTQNTYKP